MGASTHVQTYRMRMQDGLQHVAHKRQYLCPRTCPMAGSRNAVMRLQNIK